MANEKSSGASGGRFPDVKKQMNGCELAYWIHDDGKSNRQNVKLRWYWRNVNGEYSEKSVYLYERELRSLLNIGAKFLGEVELFKQSKGEGGGGG